MSFIFATAAAVKYSIQQASSIERTHPRYAEFERVYMKR